MLKSLVKDFLSDEGGRLSTGRLMSLLTLMTAIGCIMANKDTDLILGLVALAIGGKTLQAAAER